MSDPSFNEVNEADRRRLSELADGEADAQTAQRACQSWRDNAGVRECWHTYHLIGDVLRSEDLAHKPERDERFLAALRARLAQEPAILAPTANPFKQAAVPRHRRWMAPAAVAAGFVVVAGVVAITRVSSPAGDGTVELVAAPAHGSLVAASQPDSMADVQALVADGKLIRDARLERYLAAHKQYGGSSAVTVPGVVLRSSATVPER